jgi:hypothetical protein
MTDEPEQTLPSVQEDGSMTILQEDNKPVMENKEITLFQGIAAVAFDKEVQDKLLAPIDENEVEIRPEGLIYYPEILYRKRLNEALGAGAWALMPRGDKLVINGNTMMRPFAMYIHGRFIAETIGEGDYIPSNQTMTYASVAEGVKSNALMRCCKDIGIASELWQPNYINKWKKDHAVKVWVKKKDGKRAVQWRRTDRDAFWNETCNVPDNQPTQTDSGYDQAEGAALLGALPKPVKATETVTNTSSALPEKLCAVCAKPMSQIPAGVSKTSGKPYPAFFACKDKTHKQPR